MPSKTTQKGEEDIRAFYKWLGHTKDEFTEIRAIPWPSSGSVIQQWVQNEEDFVNFCRKFNGKRQVYAGINPRKRMGGSKEDVSRVTGIPFDIDAKKPKDLAATDEELADAKKRMIELVSWVRVQGYQQPLITMSGNGYHDISKVNILITDDLPEKLEAFFHEVNTFLNLNMDSIFDLPRIIKVPGTMSVKGVHTEERPHRLSYILTLGDEKPDEKLAKHILELTPGETVTKPAAPPSKTKRKTSKLRPCFKRFAEEGGKLSEIRSEDHLLRLALVQEAHVGGYSRDQIIDLFRKSEDFDEKVTIKQVDHELELIKRKGARSWRCIKIYKHKGCLGKDCPIYKKQVAKHLPKEPLEPSNPARFFKTDEEGNPKEFVPARLGDFILESDKLVATSEKSHIWAYKPKKGIWENDGTELIQEIATECLGDLFEIGHVSQVCKYIRYKNYVSLDVFESDPSKIVVKNGVLNLKTGELEPFGHKLYATNSIPVIRNPEATFPKIKKFLDEIHYEEDIPIIQEIVGYCLLKKYPFAKAFMLLGPGENGKSTELNLIEALLGKENVAAPSLQDLLYNRFAKAELYNKLANIHADIPPTRLERTGTFKMLTGQDLIYMERKYRDPFYAKNHAKLIYSANELPETKDLTLAFFRRWILIKFPNTFPEGGPNTDPHILEKLTTPEELSGFLNWALEGLRRLLKQGHFTRTTTRETVENEWIMKTDSLRAFVNKLVKVKRGTFITKQQFYELYKEFCVEYDLEVVTMAAVGHRLPTIIPQTGEIKPTVDGKRQKAWKDIYVTDGTDVTDISITPFLGVTDHKDNESKDGGKSGDKRSLPKSGDIGDSSDIGKCRLKLEAQLKEIRDWILTNKDADWDVSRFKLEEKISEYGLNVTEIVDGFKKEGLISDSNIIGAWRITNTSQEKKPKTLAEKLKITLQLITSIEKEMGMTSREKLLERLQTEYNILAGEADKLVTTLLTDGVLFSPREGYLKKT